MLQVKVQRKIYHIEKTFYALSFHRLHFLEFFTRFLLLLTRECMITRTIYCMNLKIRRVMCEYEALYDQLGNRHI